MTPRYQSHVDQGHGGAFLGCPVCRASATFPDVYIDEPIPARPTADPRRERIALEIERLNDAIERDHIETEGAHVSQLRIERNALFAEIAVLPRTARTTSEPAGEVRSLED